MAPKYETTIADTSVANFCHCVSTALYWFVWTTPLHTDDNDMYLVRLCMHYCHGDLDMTLKLQKHFFFLFKDSFILLMSWEHVIYHPMSLVTCLDTPYLVALYIMCCSTGNGIVYHVLFNRKWQLLHEHTYYLTSLMIYTPSAIIICPYSYRMSKGQTSFSTNTTLKIHFYVTNFMTMLHLPEHLLSAPKTPAYCLEMCK